MCNHDALMLVVIKQRNGVVAPFGVMNAHSFLNGQIDCPVSVALNVEHRHLASLYDPRTGGGIAADPTGYQGALFKDLRCPGK